MAAMSSLLFMWQPSVTSRQPAETILGRLMDDDHACFMFGLYLLVGLG